MTAVFVIITGLAGVLVSPFLLKLLPIRNTIARGVLLGMGAHGTGTAKAFALGPIEGMIACLSMNDLCRDSDSILHLSYCNLA